MAGVGRRYERLLMLTAPISAAALFVLATAAASASQEELVRASCYERSADLIHEHAASLNQIWEKAKDHLSEPFGAVEYHSKVSDATIAAPLECFKLILKERDVRGNSSPSSIEEGLRKDAAELRKIPLNFFGIEVPEVAPITFSGLTLQVPLTTLALALQIVLAPIMILWLSSLYNTRHREIEEIAKATSFATVFPHVINVFPIDQGQTIRKRTFGAAYYVHFMVTVYLLVRLVLLSLFVGPPVAAYLASLVISMQDSHLVMYFAGIVLISLFTLANCVMEAYPAILMKVFPMSDLAKRRLRP